MNLLEVIDTSKGCVPTKTSLSFSRKAEPCPNSCSQISGEITHFLPSPIISNSCSSSSCECDSTCITKIEQCSYLTTCEDIEICVLDCELVHLILTANHSVNITC